MQIVKRIGLDDYGFQEVVFADLGYHLYEDGTYTINPNYSDGSFISTDIGYAVQSLHLELNANDTTSYGVEIRLNSNMIDTNNDGTEDSAFYFDFYVNSIRNGSFGLCIGLRPYCTSSSFSFNSSGKYVTEYFRAGDNVLTNTQYLDVIIFPGSNGYAWYCYVYLNNECIISYSFPVIELISNSTVDYTFGTNMDMRIKSYSTTQISNLRVCSSGKNYTDLKKT